MAHISLTGWFPFNASHDTNMPCCWHNARGRSPYYRTTIVSCMWRFTKCTQREIRIVDLPGHPSTGHATSCAAWGKYILYIQVSHGGLGFPLRSPFPPCSEPVNGSPGTLIQNPHPNQDRRCSIIEYTCVSSSHPSSRGPRPQCSVPLWHDSVGSPYLPSSPSWCLIPPGQKYLPGLETPVEALPPSCMQEGHHQHRIMLPSDVRVRLSYSVFPTLYSFERISN